jgi:hypothetical protein
VARSGMTWPQKTSSRLVHIADQGRRAASLRLRPGVPADHDAKDGGRNHHKAAPSTVDPVHNPSVEQEHD